MLKPDAARQQLGTLKSKKHGEARLARARKLPKALAATALGVFGRLPDGNYPKEWQERDHLRWVSTIEIADDPKARVRVFTALFPTFHVEVEAGWQLLARLPYTRGYARRAFRAPDRPEMYHQKRQPYLEEVLACVEQLPDDSLTADWLAAWAVHLSGRADSLGYLLAGVIDAGGRAARCAWWR